MKLKLNTFLIKEVVDDPYEYINLEGMDNTMTIPLKNGETCTLNYGTTESTPAWYRALSGLSNEQEKLLLYSASGVIIIRIKKYWMIVSFGHGWQRINREGIVRNFGIKCALNISQENAIKAIKRDRISSETLQAIEQIPDQDEISRFGIDIYQDLLRGVKVNADASYRIGTTVSGTDSLIGIMDTEVDCIDEYLNRCIDIYDKETYKNNFKWLDNISPISDRGLKIRLDWVAAKAITRSQSNLCFCLPHLDAWDQYDIASFERKKKNQAPINYEFEVGAWKKYMEDIGNRIDLHAMHNKKIYLYSSDGQPAGNWTIRNCLHSTIEYRGKTYILHAGEWFYIDDDYVHEIDKKISDIDISKISLPKAELNETEPEYNIRVAQESNGAILSLDANFIHVGGGRNKIEVCDLLSNYDLAMICVKPWKKISSSISHLLNQAIVTAQLTGSNKEFQEKVKEKLEGEFIETWNLACTEPKFELTLAILRGPKIENLPFFAKIALTSCAQKIREMRFNPTYINIDIKKQKKK